MKPLRIALLGLAVAAIAACGGDAGEPAVEQTAGAAPAAQAAEPDKRAQQAVKVRKAVLTLTYNNFGPLANMARGRIPFDGEVAATNAMRLHQLARMLGDSFAYDTRGSGVETEALDAIWSDADGFAGRVADFVAAAEALDMAAQGGDEDQIKAAAGNVGKTCGGCHDNYREDDD